MVATVEPEPAPRRDPREVRMLMDSINSSLSSVQARGDADESELYAIQQQIAQLPPAERSQALMRLNRVINSSGITDF